ncbi:MAG TPA: hypothetical protein ENI49_02475, partial [Thermoplasmatales archaeon]|nr:hypothetical protein [Thermoplasmatales archaeon]
MKKKIVSYFVVWIVLFSICSTMSFSEEKNALKVNYGFFQPTTKAIKDYQVLEIPGLHPYIEPGKPIVPVKITKILIPQGKKVASVNVITGKEKSLGKGFNIEIAKEPKPTDAENEDTTPTFSGTFPKVKYEVLPVQMFRGYKILPVRLFPVKYSSENGEVTYVQSMEIVVQLENDGVTPIRGFEEDEKLVKKIVDNIDAVNTYKVKTSPTQSLEYVIITNDTLAPTFQAYADWKTAHGTATTVVTTSYIYTNYTGIDDQEKIRNYIKDAYTTEGISYVLLGGDVDIIPHRGMYVYAGSNSDNDIPCDMYYGALDGTWDKDGDGIYGEAADEGGSAGEEADFFAEVYVGRAPVNTVEEAQNFINKTENFSANFKALMIGTKLNDDPLTWGGDYKDEIKAYIPYEYSTSTLYERDGTGSTSAVVNALNSGENIVNHMGHGWNGGFGYLSRADVDGLTNTEYFLVYSQGCYTASFDNRKSDRTYETDDCIAEHFVYNSTGAIAFIGNSRYGWYAPGSTNGSSQLFDKEFFDALFNENIVKLGNALQDSKEDLYGVGWRWVYFELNLLGDPTLDITTQPNYAIGLSCTNNPQTSLPDNSLTYNVKVTNMGKQNDTIDLSLTVPTGWTGNLSDSQVYLTSGDSTTVTATINVPSGTASDDYISNFIATSQWDPSVSNTLNLVTMITSGNIVYESHTIDDNKIYNSWGNGDGIVNPDELIELPVT